MKVEENYRASIGKQLKAIREKKGLTRYRVYMNGGLAVYQVNAIESGSANYTIDILLKYIAAVGVGMNFEDVTKEII